MTVKVNITTEDGDLLDVIVVEDGRFPDPIKLSNAIVDVIERNFKTKSGV